MGKFHFWKKKKLKQFWLGHGGQSGEEGRRPSSPPNVSLPELPTMAVFLHFTVVAWRSSSETKWRPPLSCLLFLSESLFLSHTVSLSRQASGSSAITRLQWTDDDMHCTAGTRAHRCWGGQLPSCRIAAVGGSEPCVGRSWLPDEICHSSATFDDQSWCHEVLLSLRIVMVPSIRDESARIGGRLFHVNLRNFDSWSEPNRALFWGNKLTLLIVAKNDFQWYIMCLCLDLYAKSHVFREKL